MDQTENVTVDWVQGVIPYSEIDNTAYTQLDKTGFYALCIGTYDATQKVWNGIRLLYVGQAYDQTLRERIKQPHPAYTCTNAELRANPTYRLLIKEGYVTQPTSQRITQSLVDDIEVCLIRTNQPPCNTQSKDSYNGRDLTVTNLGDYVPLREKSRCKKA
jgi:hypothetical protein